MRASRLVSLLLLLQTRGRLTARQLADELEVSVRTIYRDVESLHTAGVPLYGDAGHAGGYQLLDGYHTRLTGLTTEEAESLFLTGLPGPAAELGLGTAVAATRLKLTAALPPELRDRAGRLRERFHLDMPNWYTDGEETPRLTGAANAVWTQRRIRVHYRRWKEPTDVTRTLDPYGLVLKAGRWYLVAGADGRVRTYRVSQILELTVLDEDFPRPDGFDLAAHWQSSLADFELRRHTGEAVVRFSPTALLQLPDMLGTVARRSIERTAEAPDAQGWVQAVVPFESLGHALGEFLRFGGEVEVLGPPELRERLTRTAAELARIYCVPTLSAS
ncbi:helix-turn-helix transcriptional regulator [Amycolatopsis sp. H20-H5]|uniref:helix-turn-helix transcriptional regulator n=1 Tax=Amycolatopsis sp. H20-H5 TaxID=3046309 RepID=UPI002DB674D4|nr:YafY family protein [Amycolatopsis sp. H20-H5]MEC3976107.1 YafY family protein [Amycolatopsis sp. H20-H5]